MNKILVAVTYHDQVRPTIHKTLRSTQFRNPLPNAWRCDTVVFCHTQRAPAEGWYQQTTDEETLGGKRNYAVRWARANNYQLIAFLDDDDLFGPSWITNLCAQADADFYAGIHDRIYHPQWNVLFDPRAYVVREHIGQADPRFDSRDMMFYNPWSALSAFHPLSAKWLYREHKKSDPRLSFEDWSFNLDTWCDGQEHVVVPDTYHFLRMRANSLGKSTIRNTLEHTKYFKAPELIQKTTATMELGTESDLIDHTRLLNEMQAVSVIEPQLYYWRMPKVNQQYNNRAGRTADLVCEVVKQMPFARDIFWMHDHRRIGGAEKALAWVAEFLRDFKDKDGSIPHQVCIDDITVNTQDAETVAQWGHAMTHLLRVWAQEGKGRSLHICNTAIGWNSIVTNPALFDGIEVYLYVFNDDLMFPDDKRDMTQAGYHSPIYNCAEVLDRPNFHLIVDSDHHGKKLAEITGMADRIRKIAVPVRGMPDKRKSQPGGMDILWAGRLDHFKGIDELIATCDACKPNHVTVYGDGPREWTDKLIAAAERGSLTYGGRYDDFASIPGQYDFFLFTSEREGNPNVMREAIASRLTVLARKGAPWLEEFPRGYIAEYTDLIQGIFEMKNFHHPISGSPPSMLERSYCEPLAIAAFKECLVL